MKLLTITVKDGRMYVKDHQTNGLPTKWVSKEWLTEKEAFEAAKEFCRGRLGKLLQDDNLNIFKIPFIDLWLVW